MTDFPKWRDVRADVVAGAGGEEAVAEARKRNHAFDAQYGPEDILRALPAREQGEFLRQCEAAGRNELREVLHAWSLVVKAANKPGYYETLEAVRTGTVDTVPIQEVVPDWDERVAAVRSRPQAHGPARTPDLDPPAP